MLTNRRFSLLVSGCALLVAATALALPVSGCGTGAGGEEPFEFTIRSLPQVTLDTTVDIEERPYRVGMVPAAFAVDRGDQGERFMTRVWKAATVSECLVVRPRMDWVEFGPQGEGRINDDLVATVNTSREFGVENLVIEIDPVADRRNVGLLPPELYGMNFSDEAVREPVKRLAKEIALQLRPTYLSIGVEMNGYFESNPEDFENYVSLHKETYDLVKTVAPEVQFIAAFNLEAMQGFFGDLDEFSNHPPQWFVIDMFEPKLDAVAFSTLPFGFFAHPMLIPDDYLSRIERHTSRDILFTEIGWPGDPNHSTYTLASQAEYLAHMVRLLDRMSRVRLLTWATLFDADAESPILVTEEFKTLGLNDEFNNPKPGMEVWQQLYALPYRP